VRVTWLQIWQRALNANLAPQKSIAVHFVKVACTHVGPHLVALVDMWSYIAILCL